jgi:DNA polymerase III subunit gamma/tau
LSDWTGRRWALTVSNEEGAPTLDQQAKRRVADRVSEAEALPLVQAMLKSFPGATVDGVRETGAGAAATPAAPAESTDQPALDIDPDFAPEVDPETDSYGDLEP